MNQGTIITKTKRCPDGKSHIQRVGEEEEERDIDKEKEANFETSPYFLSQTLEQGKLVCYSLVDS